MAIGQPAPFSLPVNCEWGRGESHRDLQVSNSLGSPHLCSLPLSADRQRKRLGRRVWGSWWMIGSFPSSSYVSHENVTEAQIYLWSQTCQTFHTSAKINNLQLLICLCVHYLKVLLHLFSNMISHLQNINKNTYFELPMFCYCCCIYCTKHSATISITKITLGFIQKFWRYLKKGILDYRLHGEHIVKTSV